MFSPGKIMKGARIVNYVAQSGGKVSVDEIVRELDIKEKDIKKSVDTIRKKMGIKVHV